MLSVVAAIFAALLTVGTVLTVAERNANALEKRTLVKGIAIVSLSRGESFTVSSGTVLEALQDGSAVLIGGGGSIVTWTFKDHDVFVMQAPYQTIKNKGDKPQRFYAIEVRQ